MKIVALVPIKLNSQRLPHKNILEIGGHPLCWHICNSLLQIKLINEVYVFCSDEKIKNYIPEGIHFLKRSTELDRDSTKGFQIYDAFIKKIDADIYVLAHTTSPFVKAQSITNALSHVVSGANDSAFSAEKVQTFAWYKNKPINYQLTDVPRTQDMEPIWIETSGFYIFRKEIYTKSRRRIGFMPYIQEVSGIEAIDIDEAIDFELACKLIGEASHV